MFLQGGEGKKAPGVHILKAVLGPEVGEVPLEAFSAVDKPGGGGQPDPAPTTTASAWSRSRARRRTGAGEAWVRRRENSGFIGRFSPFL